MEHTKGTAKIAKDPICGMTVDPSKAAATVEFDGQPYYFCSKGCTAKFQQDTNKSKPIPPDRKRSNRAARRDTATHATSGRVSSAHANRTAGTEGKRSCSG